MSLIKTLSSRLISSTTLLQFAAVALATIVFLPVASADEERWNLLKESMFGDAVIDTSGVIVALEAPSRAHDAAVVPVIIKALDPGRRIEQVHLIVDMNPLPLAGIFKFSEDAGAWHSLETRIRINEYTNVRVVAKLQDGSLHMASQFVKAAGGCSAPAMADMEAAMARAGKMKLMIDKINRSDAFASEAVVKISHPNNSGMQFDQISRNYIPAFYVHTIGVNIDGKKLIEVETNFSLSENPVVRFQFDADSSAESSSLTAYALDSKGNQYRRSIAVDGESNSVVDGS